MLSFKNSNMQGNFGLGLAIAYYTKHEFTVSIPLTDTQEFDIIISKDGVNQTVQVKTFNTKRGVRLKNGGKKQYSNLNLDILFVVNVKTLELYEFAAKDLNNKTSIGLEILSKYKI